MNEHIPNTIRDGLTTLVENLDTTCGRDLVSVVLYDGLVKNTQIKETDTIKVMLVMENIDTGILDQLAEVFSSFSLKDQLQPLVLSEADLRSSTDVFPIKFLDMQQDHEILHGKDILKDLAIEREHLQLRCEQEIKNLMLRLRKSYLMGLDQKGALPRIMLRSYFTLIRALDVMAELKTNKSYRREDEILNTVEELGLEVEVLRRIRAIRDDQPLKDIEEQKKVFNQLMVFLRKAAVMVDGI